MTAFFCRQFLPPCNFSSKICSHRTFPQSGWPKYQTNHWGQSRFSPKIQTLFFIITDKSDILINYYLLVSNAAIISSVSYTKIHRYVLFWQHVFKTEKQPVYEQYRCWAWLGSLAITGEHTCLNSHWPTYMIITSASLSGTAPCIEACNNSIHGGSAGISPGAAFCLINPPSLSLNTGLDVIIAQYRHTPPTHKGRQTVYKH